jgi:hypothetical protein
MLGLAAMAADTARQATTSPGARPLAAVHAARKLAARAQGSVTDALAAIQVLAPAMQSLQTSQPVLTGGGGGGTGMGVHTASESHVSRPSTHLHTRCGAAELQKLVALHWLSLMQVVMPAARPAGAHRRGAAAGSRRDVS